MRFHVLSKRPTNSFWPKTTLGRVQDATQEILCNDSVWFTDQLSKTSITYIFLLFSSDTCDGSVDMIPGTIRNTRLIMNGKFKKYVGILVLCSLFCDIVANHEKYRFFKYYRNQSCKERKMIGEFPTELMRFSHRICYRTQ